MGADSRLRCMRVRQHQTGGSNRASQHGPTGGSTSRLRLGHESSVRTPGVAKDEAGFREMPRIGFYTRSTPVLEPEQVRREIDHRIFQESAVDLDHEKGSGRGIRRKGTSFSRPSRNERIRELIRNAEPLSVRTRQDCFFMRDIGLKLYGMKSTTALTSFFNKCDTNGNGKLSYDELFQGVQKFNLGMDEHMFARFAKTLDSNNSGDISFQEMCTFFERYEPLMPDAARYLDQWQATQTKDNTMTAAPFGTDIPVREHFKNFNKKLFYRFKKSEHKPGSYEEQMEDLLIRKLLSTKFNNKESKVRNTFRKFDVNRDGQISQEEFANGLRNLGLGLSEEQIERHMQYIEKDADGFIPYETYLDKFIDLDDRINNRIGFNPYINAPRSQEQVAKEQQMADDKRKAAERVMKARTEAMKDQDDTWLVKTFREKMLDSKSKVMTALRQFDVNGDGFISREELERAVALLVPGSDGADVKGLLEAFDTDKDGYLSHNEFLRMFEDRPHKLGQPLCRESYWHGHNMAPGHPADPKYLKHLAHSGRKASANPKRGNSEPPSAIAVAASSPPPQPPHSNSRELGSGAEGGWLEAGTPKSAPSPSQLHQPRSGADSATVTGPGTPLAATPPPSPLVQRHRASSADQGRRGRGFEPERRSVRGTARAGAPGTQSYFRPASAGEGAGYGLVRAPECSRPRPRTANPTAQETEPNQIASAGSGSADRAARAMAPPAPFAQLSGCASTLSNKQRVGRHAWNPVGYDTTHVVVPATNTPQFMNDQLRLGESGGNRDGAHRASQIEDRRKPQMAALARGSRRLELENRLEERAKADDRKFDQDERDRLASKGLQKQRWVERMRLYDKYIQDASATRIRSFHGVFQPRIG